MASTKEYLIYVLDNLNNVDNISYRKMMGEYLLYSNGILFGGIYDDRFLIKMTPSLSNMGLKEEIPYDGAKNMYLIDTDDKEYIKDIIQIALNDLSK